MTEVVRNRLVFWSAATAVVVITAWSAAALGVDLSALLRNLGRAKRILGDSFPPDVSFLPRLIGPFVETLQIAVIGTVIGAAVALPLAILAARPVAPSYAVYFVDRNFMNVLRTLPDLFWAMLFATAVGFGPLAGVLALSVFTVAVVAKLLSESIESIDLKLLEAVEASGGTWTEKVWFGVLPQVLPHFVSYVLYAFELNVRASMILGLVGAGGLGMVLEKQRTQFQWASVSMIIVVVFLVVVLLDWVSSAARRRLVEAR